LEEKKVIVERENCHLEGKMDILEKTIYTILRSCFKTRLTWCLKTNLNFVKEEVLGIKDGHHNIGPDHPVLVEMFA
jgi:hypothetical protein